MIHCHHLELKTKLKRTSAEIKEENLNNKVARTAQQSEFSAEDWWESAARRRVLIWFQHGQIQQWFRQDLRRWDWNPLLKLLNCCRHLNRLQLCFNSFNESSWNAREPEFTLKIRNGKSVHKNICSSDRSSNYRLSCRVGHLPSHCMIFACAFCTVLKQMDSNNWQEELRKKNLV